MKHQDEQLRFLVMPKYGRSLENYRVDRGGVLDCSEAFTVAKQCVNCLEYMHHKNYVHSDVKADNILLPLNDSIEQCYLVDFGLARIAKSNVEVADKKRGCSDCTILPNDFLPLLYTDFSGCIACEKFIQSRCLRKFERSALRCGSYLTLLFID
ncbi:unnamed protein product [Anisakis simplex]|uniref:non-specific serine/threonine protein kinase n=1 Tax=Anisakis simplex TaxID=6269 RepID=A0A0M3JCK9_ANISI|nr:unnamed protein product [Anisakis simplex]